MAVVYYVVFLTTPLDIKFHAGTAMDRLLLQLWPLALFSLAVLLSPAELEGSGCGEG